MISLSNNHKIKSVTDDKNYYCWDEMYEVYENIVTVEIPTLTQVNTVFEAHLGPTSNPAYECYLFRELKQRHDEIIHEFYVRLKEQGQKSGFTDLNREIKQLVELATCSHKLRCYSFQNPDKSLSELLTIAKFFEDMKICVEKVGKRDVHPFNALHRAPHRSSKKGSLNRRGTSSYNKIFIRSGGVSPHKGKCPPESTFCYKCKKILYSSYYTKCFKTKLTQKVITTRTVADKIHILDQHRIELLIRLQFLRSTKVSLVMRCILTSIYS